MEDRYGGWTSMRNGDFQEGDVWGIISGSNSSTPMSSSSSKESSNSTFRRLPTAAKMIPRLNNPIHEPPKLSQQSAPVSIPDWSKIYGRKQDSRKASNEDSSWSDVDDVPGGVTHDGGDSDGDDDDDDYDDYAKVPPHEWIARKLSRNQISSFSVFEGVGRTLKGRDLSRVRNAVLSKTGFLE